MMPMKTIISFLLAVCAFPVFGQLNVEDFRRKGETDDAAVLNRAMQSLDSAGHGSLNFDGMRTYYIKKNVELPRYKTKGRRIFVFNGNGAKIVGQGEVNVFNRVPKDMKETSKLMSSRFVFNDMTIYGGNKGINLCATYGSSINRCNFGEQKIAAVDIQFGLQTKISECNATNCRKDAFVLRSGKDFGGNNINSQSNHSVIESSRVFAKDGASSCFKILASSGVVLRDIISEGSSGIDYSIYFDQLTSNCVKLFKVENFHLEHKPQKAAIYTRNDGITTIDGVYYQLAFAGFTLVYAGEGSGQITLRNIPWYVAGTKIKQERNAYWRVEYCHKNFYIRNTWLVKVNGVWKSVMPAYFSGRGGRVQVEKAY